MKLIIGLFLALTLSGFAQLKQPDLDVRTFDSLLKNGETLKFTLLQETFKKEFIKYACSEKIFCPVDGGADGFLKVQVNPRIIYDNQSIYKLEIYIYVEGTNSNGFSLGCVDSRYYNYDSVVITVPYFSDVRFVYGLYRKDFELAYTRIMQIIKMDTDLPYIH